MNVNKSKIINILNKEPYFLLIKNFERNPHLLKKKIIDFSKVFKKIRKQDSKGNIILEIKPNEKKIKIFKKKRKNIKSILRYHQTNLGGSIHSDGPQLNNSPKYIVMACEQNAITGGDTILVNTKKIFEYLKKKNNFSLNILTKKFYFERRGFRNKNQNVFRKPIFSNIKNKFIFRYLRDYIEKGFELKKKSLSFEQKKSLDDLDILLSKKKFSYKFKLSSGDLLILNNHILAHGRSAFNLNQTKKIKNKQRKLYRVWLH